MTPRMLDNGYRGHNDNFLKMIFLSLVAHLVVISLILISLPTNSRHLTFGTAYSVQLVGSDAISPAADSSLIKEWLKTKEAEQTIILKNKITSVYSEALRNQTAQDLAIQKALQGIRQKQNAPSSSGQKTDIPAETPPSDSEMSSQINAYIGMVWSKVKQNWAMPSSLLPDNNIMTILDVRIGRSGALEKVEIEKRSGNKYFDESALKAVRKSHPFPPLPSWVKEHSIEIGIRFHSAELR